MRIPNIAEIQQIKISPKIIGKNTNYKNISKVQKVNSDIDITPMYIQKNILEKIEISDCITKMGFTGTLVFFDKDNMLENFPILGGEELQIIIRDVSGISKTYNAIITRRTAIERQDQTYTYHIILDFVETDYFNLITKSYLKGVNSATDTISDIIYDIFKSSLYSDKLLSKKLIQQKIDINTPYNLSFPMFMTCEECINYLCDYITKKNGGGYYFIKDRKLEKYKLESVINIINKKPEYKFNLNKYEDFNYILEFDILDNGNLISKINNSYIYSRLYSNNNKNIKYSEIDIFDIKEDYNIKSTLVSNEAYILSKNNNSILYEPYLYNDYKESNIIRQKNEMLEDIFITQKGKIKIDGRLDLNMSDKIEILAPHSVKNKSVNIINGEWTIHRIKNIIESDGKFFQELYIVKYNAINTLSLQKNPRII